MQQPSPEQKLDNWVYEKLDEVDIRQKIKHSIQIVYGKPTIKGNFDLSGCTGLTSLPKDLSVSGNLNLSGCTGLTSLPENLNVDGDLNLSRCTGLRSMPEKLNIYGDLNLSRCTSLTYLSEKLRILGHLNLSGCTGLRSLPECLSIGSRHLYLNGCVGLTYLPESVFALRNAQRVFAINTGIPIRLLLNYNTRQNEPGYRGPRIEFSISDYQSSSNVTAAQLPQLVQSITETEANHSFWQYAANQSGIGSLYNSFAVFLTRLLNELPNGRQRIDDLKKLKATLTPLFEKMEAKYDPTNMGEATFINEVLGTAHMGIGTCIDKVKVAYVFMQLLARPNSENDLTTMDSIVKTVERIKKRQLVFDKTTQMFVDICDIILNDDSCNHYFKTMANYLSKITGNLQNEITEDETSQFKQLTESDITNILISEISRDSHSDNTNWR